MQKSNSSSILRDINKHKHIWHWYIYATSSICIPNTSIIDIPVIYIWVNKGRSRKLLRKHFSWLSYVYIYIYIYTQYVYRMSIWYTYLYNNILFFLLYRVSFFFVWTSSFFFFRLVKNSQLFQIVPNKDPLLIIKG